MSGQLLLLIEREIAREDAVFFQAVEQSGRPLRAAQERGNGRAAGRRSQPHPNA